MSDFGDSAQYAARFEGIFSAADHRARMVTLTAQRCTACGESMLAWSGRTVHFSCDPALLAGLSCTCPSGCSSLRWGDGERRCDPACVPCRRMQGRPLPARRKGNG